MSPAEDEQPPQDEGPRPALGGDEVPAGDAWVKGEAGVLPRGLAAAARARLDRQRERLAAARGGAVPGPAGEGPGGATRPDGRPTSAAGGRPAPEEQPDRPDLRPSARPASTAPVRPATGSRSGRTAPRDGDAGATPGTTTDTTPRTDGPGRADAGGRPAPTTARPDDVPVPRAAAPVRAQADPEPPPSHDDPLGLATRVVSAGIAAPVQGEPFLRGPVFAGPYHAAGEAGDAPTSTAA